MVSEPKPKLLVVELWGLGDLVIATPFLQAACEKYAVTLLAKPYALDLRARLWPEVQSRSIRRALDGFPPQIPAVSLALAGISPSPAAGSAVLRRWPLGAVGSARSLAALHPESPATAGILPDGKPHVPHQPAGEAGTGLASV